MDEGGQRRSSLIDSGYVADRLKDPGRVGWGEGVD
jgi:hypothetical protein